MAEYDLLVIGGGVNGVGIARDAAGRGLSVLLCERGDLAQATSSASSKLIHGGLRYLEQYQFRLVREALQEREVLLRAAPHIVEPLRFVLPHSSDQRPGWMIRLGLALYDHMGARKVLPASAKVRLPGTEFGKPLRPDLRFGFAYSDCRVDDSRLVILNALDAAARGAHIRTCTAVVGLQRQKAHWTVTFRPDGNNQDRTATARAVVNAAGPWIGDGVSGTAPKPVRLIKGSHITVPRLYDGDHAYILQNTDKRIIFVIPYLSDQTLIGTTDVEYDGEPDQARCSDAEVDYLCAAVNRWFAAKVRPDQVTWRYAGVRPLLDDGASDAATVSRDYRLDLEAVEGKGPILTVVGGKITTYRKLAEQAVVRLRPHFGCDGAWTAGAALPGGDIPEGDFTAFVEETGRRYSWLPDPLIQRLVRAYGSRIEMVLGGAKSRSDLGEEIAPGLFEAELDYLQREEWAQTADDALWRRSKLGLQMDDDAKARVENWFG